MNAVAQGPLPAAASTAAGRVENEPVATKLGRFDVLANSFSEVLFLKNRYAGWIFAAITLTQPNVGVAGLVSVLAAYLFSRLIGMDKAFLESGFFTYNALLVGLSIGYLFALAPMTLFLIAAAGVLTFVLSVMLNSVLAYYLRLPILSLPFVLVGSMAYLASYGYGGLYLNALVVHEAGAVAAVPVWLQGFFVSLGAVFFVPNLPAGAVVAATILASSRILFVLALAGYLAGALGTGLLTGDINGSLLQVNNFNYILIAMALGGVFLVPSPRSYVVAAIGVAVAIPLSSAVQLFWSKFGIPVFTLPFNLVTLTFVYVLGLVGFPLVAKRIRDTPEQTLDEFLCNAGRFPAVGMASIRLPFEGCWTVWQGFDGPWTHRGAWRHAYDFVIEQDGTTCSGQGGRIEDYYAWRKPVSAPCRGRIVAAIDSLPDNPPGCVDRLNNWGNLVIVESPSGFWVALSHFARRSLKVNEGDWVEVGDPLGLCGNSGFSPQPHIHVQVQGSAQVGATTLPFEFAGYLDAGEFIDSGLPESGRVVEPIRPDRGLEFRTAFFLDARMRFRKLESDRTVGFLELTVGHDQAGESYFDSGTGRLYFARNEHSFYCYRLEGTDPWLGLLFAAVPRLPLVYRHDIYWRDVLPLAAVSGRWRAGALNFVRALFHRLGQSQYHAGWDKGGVVSGVLEDGGDGSRKVIEAVLHPRLGFSRVRVGERVLQLENEP